MKKLLSFLSLLLVSIGAWAQWHWPLANTNGQGHEYVVNAEFVTNEPNYNNAEGIGVYEVAAFVNGECRVVATPRVSANRADRFQVVLRIPGNYNPNGPKDDGKVITFFVYNRRTGNEYELLCANRLTWQPDASYVNTTLTLNAATSVQLQAIEMNVGETVDLTDYMTIVPEGASLPLNKQITWSLGNYAGFGTISGNMLTATAPAGFISYGMTAPFEEYGNLTINQPATAIHIIYDANVTLRIGEDESTLNDILNSNVAYSIEPADATESVQWEIGNSDIIAQEPTGGYTLLMPGTTTLRPYISRNDGSKLYPSNPDYITVNVVQPVTDIAFNWNPQYENKANVDDDIYSRLASLVEITPGNATNQGFSFSVMSPTGGPAEGVSISDNSLVFNEPGIYTVHVVSDDNPDLYGNRSNINFVVEKPAKDLVFNEIPLTILREDGMSDEDFRVYVQRTINGNVMFGSEGITSARGTITASGSAVTINAQATAITDNGAYVDVTAVGEGTTTLTYTLQWNDYSEYDGTQASIKTETGIAQQLNVIIGSKLMGFVATHTPGENGTGTLTLTPKPEGAQYDPEELRVDMNMWGYPDGWTVLQKNIQTTASGINITYNASLPGEVIFNVYSTADPDDEVRLTVYDAEGYGSESEQHEFYGFTVPVVYSFNKGWQWRSNPFGDVRDEYPIFFNDDFLSNFIEARTQEALLINDADWGLFSDQGDFGIGQNQCYKINMKAAASTKMYSVWVSADNAGGGVLYKGWTWVGSPFVYNRLLANAFWMDGQVLPTGTRIVSKDKGFAEWNGTAWTGTLTAIEKNQGYLVYCPEENQYLSFNPEWMMEQGDETAMAGARLMKQSVWSYDATQFASNMSMVAELKNLDNPEDYTVGAFVDGECRGEGMVIDGMAFITVHGNSGELVTFRLHNELTGEFVDVNETVKSQQMLGSLQAPVALSAPVVATGISTVHSAALNAQSYDLLGRKVANGRLMIRRMADGTMRKVVKQ